MDEIQTIAFDVDVWNIQGRNGELVADFVGHGGFADAAAAGYQEDVDCEWVHAGILDVKAGAGEGSMQLR